MPNIIQVKSEKQMSNKKLRNHLLRKVKKNGIFNIITSDCHLSLNAAGTPSIAIGHCFRAEGS